MNSGFAGALLAAGPSRELDDRADFGWLVGEWAGDVLDMDPDGTIRKGRGEWWFAWVLEGRAIRTCGSRRPAAIVAKREGRSPPTIAMAPPSADFDQKEGLWRVTWIDPVSGAETSLTGRRESNRIVLNGEEDGRSIRWGFYAVTAASFLWVGESRSFEGNWTKRAEFRMRRIE